MNAETEALLRIADVQQEVLGYIRANGFVFHSIGREPGNWEHLAFSLYNDICRVDTIARGALEIPLGDRALPPMPSALALAIARADEIVEAEKELLDSGWGGYQWEHLGDATKDIHVLINGLREVPWTT